MAVLDCDLDFPAYGQLRASNEPRKRSIFAFPSGVRSIWLACMKCASNNRCIPRDDIYPILDKIRAADALILRAFPTFASVNALTKTFMECKVPYYDGSARDERF